MSAAKSNEIEQPIPLGFGGLHAKVRDHIGHFFKTAQQWEAVLVPYFKTGLARGDICVYVMNPDVHAESAIVDALASEGVDADQFRASGQLILGEGKPSPEAMEDWLTEVAAIASGGSKLVRWGGDMTWSLKQLPSSEALMKWECVCNVKTVPAVYVCQYDMTQFLGSVIVDALRTHPLCIIGGTIHKNPYYAAPEDFLAELRSDGGSPPA